MTDYEGHSIRSGTVPLIKHQANTEYQNYSEVTTNGFIYDIMQ